MARFGRSRRQSAAIEKVPHMVEHHKEDHKTTPEYPENSAASCAVPSAHRLKRTSLRVPILYCLSRIVAIPPMHVQTCVSSSQHFLIRSDVWASYPSAALDATNQPPEQRRFN